MPTPHELLGLPRSATREQIRQRYRELRNKAHPDKGGDADTFKVLTEVYEAAMALPEVKHCDTCGGEGWVQTQIENKGFVFNAKKPCPTCKAP